MKKQLNYTKRIKKKRKNRIRDIVIQRVLEYNKMEQLEDEAEGEEIEEEPTTEPQEEKWDVESILSVRTNTDNHPGIIKSIVKVKKDPIVIDPKTKAPELENSHVQEKTKKTPETPFIEKVESESDSDENAEIDETQELPDLEKMTEKERKKYLRKLNKKQVKKEKKEKRVLKKEMKKEFSKESQKYAKQNMQVQLKKIVSFFS